MHTEHFGWHLAIQNRTFLRQFSFTLALLIVCAISAPHIFMFVEHRQGFLLPDPVLDILPAYDVSIYIFVILYILIGGGLIKLARSPEQLLMALQAYFLITAFRFVTLWLVPLEAPPGLLILQDPFVDKLFYQQAVTKDLFFSGHTGILALLYFLLRKEPYWRYMYLIGAITVGVLLLVQHAHYTIDVLAAPLFAWGATAIASRIGEKRPSVR